MRDSPKEAGAYHRRLRFYRLNMYKLRLMEERKIAPWEQNFTLNTERWTAGFGCHGQYEQQRFAPIWECKDLTGECKGNARWAATFPAGYLIDSEEIIGEDAEGNTKFGTKFVYDENFGPMVNGEYITECPACCGVVGMMYED